VDRSRSGADFGLACLTVAGALAVVALLAPWRRPDVFFFFGSADRAGASVAEQRETGWETVAGLLGLRERGDVPSGWTAGEGLPVAAAALVLSVTGLALRRRGARTAGRLGPRAVALVLAAILLAGSTFAPWSDRWGGVDGWFHLTWAAPAMVLLAAGIGLVAAVRPRRVHVVVPLAAAALLAVAALDVEGNEDLGPGFGLAAVALVMALIAISWPDRRRTL
jgi:hypothetical protein